MMHFAQDPYRSGLWGSVVILSCLVSITSVSVTKVNAQPADPQLKATSITGKSKILGFIC